jgi:hypothetical protein
MPGANAATRKNGALTLAANNASKDAISNRSQISLQPLGETHEIPYSEHVIAHETAQTWERVHAGIDRVVQELIPQGGEGRAQGVNACHRGRFSQLAHQYRLHDPIGLLIRSPPGSGQSSRADPRGYVADPIGRDRRSLASARLIPAALAQVLVKKDRLNEGW